MPMLTDTLHQQESRLNQPVWNISKIEEEQIQSTDSASIELEADWQEEESDSDSSSDSDADCYEERWMEDAFRSPTWLKKEVSGIFIREEGSESDRSLSFCKGYSL